MKSVTSDLAALLLRVVAGLIFLPHGWSKVAGDGGVASFAADLARDYGFPLFLGYLAAWTEVVGAILLIAGLLTRLDALLLAGTMFVAAFVVQLPDALRDPDAAGHRFFASMRAARREAERHRHDAAGAGAGTILARCAAEIGRAHV